MTNSTATQIEFYDPQHLKLWTMPESYFGETWPGYYVFLSQHRDSDSLTRSNFECAIAALSKVSEDFEIVRESHWAVGWVEWIAIHQDDSEALRLADKMQAKLNDYPVLNEDHWSELEWNEAQNFWERLSIRDRAELCAEAGLSIFAARRPWIPEGDNGSIYERLRG